VIEKNKQKATHTYFPKSLQANRVLKQKNSLKMPFAERIDTHAHFIPPFYRKACEATGHGQPDGMPAIPVSVHFRSPPAGQKLIFHP
jgi:hypothetical protein